MPRKTGSPSQVTLNCFAIRSSQVAKLPCPDCRTVLDITQPNVDRPYQFLATCGGCGSWFRIETQPGEARGLIACMPEIAPLLANLDPSPKHPA